MPAVLQIPDTTVNPLTGATLIPGDTAPVFSYDEATGTWKDEGTATLSTSALAGKLDAAFDITHLSGWGVVFGVYPAQQCSTTVTVNGAGSTALTLDAHTDGYDAKVSVPGGTTSVELSGLAPGLNYTVDAYVSTHKVGTVQVASCTPAGPLSVSIPSPATVDVSVFTVCDNDPGRKTPVPSAAVSAQVSGAVQVTGATDATGVAHLSGFVAGDAVTVKAQDRSKTDSYVSKDATLTAGANALEFDFPVSCSVLTGTGGGTP
jgi:hypothetical protein